MAFNDTSYSRWLADEVFRLIELVKKNEAIYNSRDKSYFCRTYIENLWRSIDQELGKNSGCSLAKWTNLRISFRREYKNYLKDRVAPCWTYFEAMLFLHPYLRKKDTNSVKPKLSRSHGESSGSREYLDDIRDQHAQDIMEQQSNTDSEDHGDAYIIDDVGEENNPLWNLPVPPIRPPSCTPEIKTEDVVTSEVTSPPIEPYHSEMGSRTPRNRSNSFVRKCTSQQRQDSASTSSNISFVKPLSKSQPQQEFEHSFHHLQHTFPHFNREIPSTSTRLRNDFDLCECKTDSDAMFLMSLLPDIQSLSRRDKGRIKIEFQKIIQNYLYPDDN